MATNTGNGFHKSAVTARTQFQRPDGLYQKRDERTGGAAAKVVGIRVA